MKLLVKLVQIKQLEDAPIHITNVLGKYFTEFKISEVYSKT